MRQSAKDSCVLLLLVVYGVSACTATVESISLALTRDFVQLGVTVGSDDDKAPTLPRNTISRRYIVLPRSFSPAHLHGVRLAATTDRPLAWHQPISSPTPITLHGHGDPTSVRPPPCC
jgi:hypothetical protein